MYKMYCVLIVRMYDTPNISYNECECDAIIINKLQKL